MGYLAVVESKAWACASLTDGDTDTFLTKRDADTILNSKATSSLVIRQNSSLPLIISIFMSTPFSINFFLGKSHKSRVINHFCHLPCHIDYSHTCNLCSANE